MSPERFDGTAVRGLAQPFPLEEEWQWEYDDYGHALHSGPLHQIYQCGSVLLGSDRPGEYWTLVVPGPQRGQIWWLRDGCAAPYADSPSAQLEGGFHGWIRDWHVGQGWWRPEYPPRIDCAEPWVPFAAEDAWQSRFHRMRIWHALWVQRIDERMAKVRRRQTEEERARRNRPAPPDWMV